MLFQTTEDERAFKVYKKVYNKIKKAIEINQTSEFTATNLAAIMKQANLEYELVPNDDNISQKLVVAKAGIKFDGIINYTKVVDLFHQEFDATSFKPDIDNSDFFNVYQSVVALYTSGRANVDTFFDYNSLFELTPECHKLNWYTPEPLTLDWILEQISESMKALELPENRIKEIDKKFTD